MIYSLLILHDFNTFAMPYQNNPVFKSNLIIDRNY